MRQIAADTCQQQASRPQINKQQINKQSDPGFENRVTLFCFLLTVLVVYVHALNLQEGSALYETESFLSGFIGSAAVPGFFLMSGYLFFRGMDVQLAGAGSRKAGIRIVGRTILEKWKRRVRSLLLPYLIWNGIYYLLYVLLRGEPLTAVNLFEALIHYRYNPVFWYMQELMILTLLAPFIFYPAYNRFLRGAAMVGVFFLAVNYASLPFHIVNEDALLYYLIGASLALDRRHSPETMKPRTALFYGVLYTALAVICGILFRSDTIYKSQEAAIGLLIAFRFCAPLALFFFLTALRLPRQTALPRFMQISFFVYALHFLIVRGLNRMLIRLFPDAELLLFAVYLLMPFLSFAAASLISQLLQSRAPRMYALLTGGRR